MTLLDIAFWTCLLMACFCVVGALLFGAAYLFGRPAERLVERIIDLSDVLDGEGRERK